MPENKENASYKYIWFKNNILTIDGVADVDLNLVWDPPWTKDKMSEAAKLELNLWANK